MSSEADDQFGEAESLICSIDVENFVSGEIFEGYSVFPGQSRVVVGDEEDDVAVEAVGGGEEGDEHVGDAVEEISGERAGGEEDSRSGEGLGAAREIFDRRSLDFESRDGGHGGGVVLPGVGFNRQRIDPAQAFAAA